MNNQVNFSVDASIIDRFGKELVAKKETALSELIKNSYDADATEVEVVFYMSTDKQAIIIHDNGVGMSRDDLLNKFLLISSDFKVDNPQSPRFQRNCAGRKGIGRFAVHRLGKKLTLLTGVNDSVFWKLEVDWKQFIRKRKLETIPIQLDAINQKEYPFGSYKLPLNRGTCLIIEELNDDWSEAQQRKIYRYTSSIIHPFPDSFSQIKLEGYDENDPGFDVKIIGFDGKRKQILADSQKAVFDFALAKIDITFNSKSMVRTLESKYLNLPVSKIRVIWGENSYENHVKSCIGKNNADISYSDSFKLNNTKCTAFFFLQKSEYIPRTHSGAIREILKEYGGIRVFRNGFRVLPYGEPDDDWLSLDRRVTEFYDVSSIGRKSILGFVQINGVEHFDETSSREGLLHVPAFKLLQSLLSFEIRDAIKDILSEHKHKNQQKPRYSDPKDIIDPIVQSIDKLTDIKQHLENPEDRDDMEKAIESMEQVRNYIKEVVSELEMYRILSGLGLAIGQFVHEIRDRLHDIDSITERARKQLEESVYKEHFLNLINKINSFRVYTTYFESAMIRNLDRRKEVIYINVEARKFRKNVIQDTNKKNIDFPEPEEHGYVWETNPMHPSEWPSIFFNLYTNAIKAIEKTSNPGKIKIRLKKIKGKIIIDFYDNGIGIPVDSREKIFEPFFTTTSYAEENEHQGVKGMGLGLKIIKDIIKSNRGDIYVIDSDKTDYTTCIRIEIPAKND